MSFLSNSKCCHFLDLELEVQNRVVLNLRLQWIDVNGGEISYDEAEAMLMSVQGVFTLEGEFVGESMSVYA